MLLSDIWSILQKSPWLSLLHTVPWFGSPGGWRPLGKWSPHVLSRLCPVLVPSPLGLFSWHWQGCVFSWRHWVDKSAHECDSFLPFPPMDWHGCRRRSHVHGPTCQLVYCLLFCFLSGIFPFFPSGSWAGWLSWMPRSPWINKLLLVYWHFSG